MGHTCLCFHMVIYFSHSINYLLLHFYCYSRLVVFFFFLFRFYPYRCLLIVHYIYTFSFLFFNRWPYPFLDLSSSYAPLWYAAIIYLIVIIMVYNDCVYYCYSWTSLFCMKALHLTLNAKIWSKRNSQHGRTSFSLRNIDKIKLDHVYCQLAHIYAFKIQKLPQ